VGTDRGDSVARRSVADVIAGIAAVRRSSDRQSPSVSPGRQMAGTSLDGHPGRRDLFRITTAAGLGLIASRSPTPPQAIAQPASDYFHRPAANRIRRLCHRILNRFESEWPRNYPKPLILRVLWPLSIPRCTGSFPPLLLMRRPQPMRCRRRRAGTRGAALRSNPVRQEPAGSHHVAWSFADHPNDAAPLPSLTGPVGLTRPRAQRPASLMGAWGFAHHTDDAAPVAPARPRAGRPAPLTLYGIPIAL
jgi:hypothetical protein